MTEVAQAKGAPRGQRDPLAKYVVWMLVVTVAALVLAYAIPGDASGRAVAMGAVALAAASGVGALGFKRQALRREKVNDALKVLGIVFGVRVVMVGVGVFWVNRAGLPVMAFVGGFFGLYFALQWIEISYVLAELKRLGRGGG